MVIDQDCLARYAQVGTGGCPSEGQLMAAWNAATGGGPAVVDNAHPGRYGGHLAI